MKYTLINRRILLSVGLGSIVSPLFLKISPSLANSLPSDDVILHFQKWSHIATGFSDITFKESKDYLTFCMQRGFKIKDIARLDRDHYKGTSLEKKLLEGWMTGLMHLHGSQVERYYDSILMWRAAGLDVKPLTCQKEHHSWGKAPPEL